MHFQIYFMCLFVSVYCKKLPSYVEVCHRNDPKISDCLKRNVEILRPRFKKGIPELGVPSFDPLIIPSASLRGGPNFEASFKQIKIYNADNFVIRNLEFDIKKVELKLNIMFPYLRIKSQYFINGRILVLQLDGNGPADGNYTNVEAITESHGGIVTKNGKQHVQLTENKLDVKIGKLHLNFERIFGDNEELNDQTNKIINENAGDLVIELKPVITEVVSNFVFGLAGRAFDKYTYDELFPDV